MAITFSAAANNATLVGTGQSVPTTQSCTLPSAVVAGDIVMVAALGGNATQSAAPASLTISDAAGDTYTDSGLGKFQGTGFLSGFAHRLGAFLNPTVGQTVFTVTISSGQVGSGGIEIYAWRFSGFVGQPTIDKAVTANGNSTALDSGSSGTLSAAVEAAIGFGTVEQTVTAAGSGWTAGSGATNSDGISTITGDIGEHQVTASTAAIDATATGSPSGAWTASLLTVMDVIPWGFYESTDTFIPRTRRTRAAAFFRGNEGIEAAFIPPPAQTVLAGYEIAPALTKHPRPERAGAIAQKDDGNEYIQLRWQNTGWEVQPVQPPHPRPEKEAALVGGDLGIEFTEILWFNMGWEIQPVQPPAYPKPKQRAPGIKGRSEFGIPYNWFNTGWEIAPVQPPHPRPERAGAITPKDEGIEATLVPPVVSVVPTGWEIPAPMIKSQPAINQRMIAITGDNSFAAFNLVAWVDDPLPFYAHPHRERSGAIDRRSDEGNELPLINWLNYGWEVQPVQPGHPRSERAGSIMLGDIGTEAVFVPPPALLAYGWEVQPVQPPHPHPERSGALVTKDEGIEQPFINWLVDGWQVQPVEPPHPRRERSGAISPKDEGIEAAFVPPPTVAPAGWEVQPVQPPHPRPERSGALAPKDDGSQYPFINWLNAGWEIAPYQPRAYRASTGGIMPSDQGTQFTQVVWFNYGWEIPSPQPPHPRSERSGALAPKDEGIGLPFVPPPPVVPAGWEVLPVQPPHPRPERSGAIAANDQGIQLTFTNWRNFGWEIQPFQPPHRAPELKSGAFVRVDEGIETILINWLVDGWQVQPVEPPHPRREKAGAIMRGDEGIETPFVFVPLPVTWAPDINNFVPVRPHRFYGGALPTVFEAFPFFPPGPPPPPPPVPPGFVAEKVISVSTAPTFFPQLLLGSPTLPSIVNVGDPFALLVGGAQTLNPNQAYTLFVTKPDGTKYMATAPQVYVAEVDSRVRQGVFIAQSYVALIIPGSFVDQHGYWSVVLQSGNFQTQPQTFYIGPPTVLT